jgi:anti-sigma B factor antagonist
MVAHKGSGLFFHHRPAGGIDRIIWENYRYKKKHIRLSHPWRNTVDITTTNREGKFVLSINGRIDTSTAPELERAINTEIGHGSRKILLDFSRVSYISSGGLRVLLATAKKLKDPGDKFGICSLRDEVLKVFRLAGFTSIFSIYASDKEALASW